MADDWQDKTEEATPRKLQEARKKGNVSKSQDLIMGLMLSAGVLFFLLVAGFFFDRLRDLILGIFNHLMEPFGDFESIVYWGREGIYALALLMAPLLVCLFIMGIFSNVLQMGWLITFEKFKPKLDKLNIFDVKNYKRFFDSRVVMKTLFGVAKLLIVAVVLYLFIHFSLPTISRLMETNPEKIYDYLMWEVFWMALIVAAIFNVVGVLDFVFQKFRFRQEMKMTKQEVKDESKQSEGDPLVKSRLRSAMVSFIQSRMKSNVEHADVVVTNPIHYAVAIKYDAQKMSAPMCVAKGARKLAESIKELAREHDIPIVENPPLARGLYRTIDVGMYVPPDFYHSVAEVLAYVYRLNQKESPASQMQGPTP